MQRRFWMSVAVAAAALGAGAAYLTTRPAAEPPRAPEFEATAEAAHARPSTSSTAAPPKPAGGPVSATPFRDAATTATDPASLTIRVVEGVDAKAAAGVECEAVLFEDLQADLEGGAPAEIAEAHGARLARATTDAQGAAAFAGPWGSALVVARRGALVGRRLFHPARAPDEDRTLTLLDGVEIVALRADGTPAKDLVVQVATNAVSPQWKSVVRTDRAGRALVPRPWVAAARWWLRPEVIGDDVAALTTEITTPRAEPVRWTLPPTASFTVRAVGPDGGPFVAARMILLERLHGAELPAEGAAPHGAPVGVGRPVRGIARFPYAAPGRVFRAEVRHEAPGALEGSVTFVSPRVAEVDLVVDLPCGRPALAATGRVVDENGAPRVGVAVLVDAESTTSGPGKALTADDGTFRCGLKVAVEPPFPEAYRVDLRESAGTGGGRFRAEPIRDVAPVSGVVDLGTIVWKRTPPFCGGRVVDPDGRPVPGATVRFFVEAGAWIPDAPHDGMKTDAQGRFLMPALTPPRPGPESRRAVAAAAKQLASLRPVTFEPGAVDVVVPLEPCGDLSGWYRTGGPLAAGVGRVRADDHVSVVFLGPSAEGSPWLRKLDDEARTAEFHVPGWVRATHLRPGRLRVEFRRRGFAAPLHVVDDVEIRAGEVCRDPRLQDVDLSAALGRVVVTVTDEAGRPLDGAEVHVLGPDGDWRRDAADSDGRVQSDLAGATDVWATAKARRPRRVRGVTTGMEVRLEPALPCTATVRVAGDALPTHDGYELTLALHWSGETLEEAIADRGSARHPLHPAGRGSPPALMKLDGSRTAVFRLSAHGVYEVVAMLSKETTTSLVQTTNRTWLSAPEGATTAETTLTLTASDMERSTPRDR